METVKRPYPHRVVFSGEALESLQWSASQGSAGAQHPVLDNVDAALAKEDSTDAWLRRRALAALLGAEVLRRGDTSGWRRRAKLVGEAMAEHGTTDPFPLYLQVVETTTAATETGNYGDMTRDGVQRVRLDERAAARALQLSPSVVNEHRGFVFQVPLNEVINAVEATHRGKRSAARAG